MWRLAVAAAIMSFGGLASAATFDTEWTPAAAHAAAQRASAHGGSFNLPEFRVYDAAGRLVLHGYGANPKLDIGSRIKRALQSGRSVGEPTLQASLGDLQLRDGTRLTASALGRPQVIVFDYWADWCAPCKILGRQLAAWAAKQPAGSVAIVRAETDIVKATGGKLVKG